MSPKSIYGFCAIPIKIPTVFAKAEKSILKIYMESQGTLKSQKKNLENDNKFRGFMLPDFKTYYKATIIKTIVLA